MRSRVALCDPVNFEGRWMRVKEEGETYVSEGGVERLNARAAEKGSKCEWMDRVVGRIR